MGNSNTPMGPFKDRFSGIPPVPPQNISPGGVPIPPGGHLIIPNSDFLKCPECGGEAWAQLPGIKITVQIMEGRADMMPASRQPESVAFICVKCGKFFDSQGIGKIVNEMKVAMDKENEDGD